jgi:hypothetical protein
MSSPDFKIQSAFDCIDSNGDNFATIREIDRF